MRKLLSISALLFLLISNCDARQVGCLVGALAGSNTRTIEITYNKYLVFYDKKSSTELMPFLACGVSFDF